MLNLWGTFVRIGSYNKSSQTTERIKSTRNYSSVNFSANQLKMQKVKNSTFIKKAISGIAFLSSVVGAVGYLVGGVTLYDDYFKDKKKAPSALNRIDSIKNKLKFKKSESKNKKTEEGVKTIIPNTDAAKFGMNFAKIAIFATAVSGVATGISEGIPLMAIGEATNMGSAKIIETPVGTGLFGIGIASIFAGLALDNTPHLRLNKYELMAAPDLSSKANLIWKNIKVVSREIGSSVKYMVTKPFKKGFLKDVFGLTPETAVFTESINKEGKVFLSNPVLRHGKNYLMHAASFTLALGGLGIIASTFLNQKKAQKTSLVVEEGGFLFDNFGMTKFGLDKLTTNQLPAGSSYALGGIINAISQFMGIDNKDGRAMQWLGISLVFIGFSIDRGKNFIRDLKQTTKMPELTQPLRELKINLSTFIKDKAELKSLLKQIKQGKEITNEKFLKFKSALEKTVEANSLFESDKTKFEQMLQAQLKSNGFDAPIEFSFEHYMPYEHAKSVLQKASVKIFGENPEIA